MTLCLLYPGLWYLCSCFKVSLFFFSFFFFVVVVVVVVVVAFGGGVVVSKLQLHVYRENKLS